MNRVIVLVFLGLVCAQVVITKQCSKVNSCSCRNEDGSMLDIAALAATDNDTRLHTLTEDGEQAYSYSWSPCNSFTEDGTNSCNNVAICQSNLEDPMMLSYSLGTQASADFFYSESGQIYIRYRAVGWDNVDRISRIALICDPNEEKDFRNTAEKEIAVYDFELRTKHACFSAPTPPTPPTPGVVTNTAAPEPSLNLVSILLFCILLTTVVLLAVVVVGVIYMMQKGKSSKAEVAYEKLENKKLQKV